MHILRFQNRDLKKTFKNIVKKIEIIYQFKKLISSI